MLAHRFVAVPYLFVLLKIFQSLEYFCHLNPNPVGLMNSFKNLTLTVNNCEAIMSSDENKTLRELIPQRSPLINSLKRLTISLILSVAFLILFQGKSNCIEFYLLYHCQ